MKIRLALSLDIRREPPEPKPDRETDLSTSTERSDGKPRIGFHVALDPEERA